VRAGRVVPCYCFSIDIRRVLIDIALTAFVFAIAFITDCLIIFITSSVLPKFNIVQREYRMLRVWVLDVV
jgi:hypothetical protein